MTGKIFKIGVTLVLAAAIGSVVVVRAADSPKTVEKIMLQRKMAQTTNAARIKAEQNLKSLRAMDGGYPADNAPANRLGRTIVNDNPGQVTSSVGAPMGVSGVATPPPMPPGLSIGQTTYDYQHNSTEPPQIGRTAGADVVHFIWMAWDQVPLSVDDQTRYVAANTYTISTNTIYKWGGIFVSLGATSRGGYADLDVETGNLADGFFHQRSDPTLPYTSWRLRWPSEANVDYHVDDELALGGSFGNTLLWPHGAVSRVSGGPADIIHVVSHDDANVSVRQIVVYYRYDGTSWAGPVAIDSNSQLGYVVAADANSAKTAIFMHSDHNWDGFNGLLNLCYYESNTRGAGFIDGTELGPANKHFVTSYSDPVGPQTWTHIAAMYNNAGDLQCIWDEQRQANATHDIALRHWSKARGTIRPVALGYWPVTQSTGAWNLNLTKISMGIGDGGTLCKGGSESNNNYVYVCYTQFAGPSASEQADYSAMGYYNGEIYLAVSNTAGNTWAPPVNLTNTKTPGCRPGETPPGGSTPPRPDSICRSEHWSTIGRIVHDIDLFYIGDHDAGGIPQGEGTWQFNDAMYLRLPGGTTDAQYVCPVIAANYAGMLSGRTDCEFHAPVGGTDVESLTVINLGNATMTGNVSKKSGSTPWLTLTGGGGYSIPAGDPDKIVGITMNGTGLAEGLYQDTILVTHNDASKPSPQTYPIDFFVFNQFFCPEAEALKTHVASPGTLQLDVESIGRFAAQKTQNGFWRYYDSSYSIYDGSLLVAYGGDTSIVYHRFWDRVDSGQAGYWAQNDLIVDTSKYTTNSGYAKATAYMSTKSKTAIPQNGELGVNIEWYFPQTADSGEFVIGRASLTNRTASQISNVMVGVLMDMDVVPASKWGTLQSGVTNLGGSDATRNMCWQHGVDTVNAPADPVKDAAKYSCALRVLSPTPIVGAYVGNNLTDNQPGGGPTSVALYRKLATLSGISLFTDSVNGVDMYTIATLARGFNLKANKADTAKVVFALISDTVGTAHLQTAADKAAAWATANGVTGQLPASCICTCAGDPQCDGVTNALDVVQVVGRAFRGAAAKTNPECPWEWTDVDCTGATNAIDVVKMVNVAFRGGSKATNFCAHFCP